MVPELTEERHNEWDLQLPYAGLVHQLSPPIKEHSLPDLDNTVKTLFYWAMDLDIPHGPRLALLTILRHIDWKEGDHCIAGIQTLARESQFSKKTLKGHLKYLVDAKLISRFRHIGRTTETRLGTVGVETTPMVGVETTPMVGVETTPMVGVEPTPETNSSSTNPINQLGTGLVDAKRVDDSEPEPEPDGVTDGGLNSFSLEEERTGDRVTTPEAQAWVDSHISETPMESQARQCLDHTWAVWEYPAHPYGWKHGKEAAIKHVMASLANWTKFRKDLVEKLVLAGLPKPMAHDPENDRARERSAAWMDQRLEEAPQRVVDIRCARCRLSRRLKPGETHCHPCRKALVEVP